MSLVVIREYQPQTEICSNCPRDKSCCETMPGCFLPSDFGQNEEEIRRAVWKEMLDGGVIFDYWEGPFEDTGVQSPKYLRPRTTEEKSWNQIVYGTYWGGKCNFLGESGCTRKFENRPAECRNLEPKKDGSCKCTEFEGKKTAVKGWLPYQQMISELIEEYDNDSQ